MLRSRQSNVWNRAVCAVRAGDAHTRDVPERPRTATLCAAFLLAATALVPSVASAVVSLTAFGSGSVAVPSTTSHGAVLAREYITPQEFCGASTCEITGSSLANKGNIIWGWTKGPDLETNVSGVSTRMLIDGTPLTETSQVTLRNVAEVQLFRDSRAAKNGSLNSGSFSQYFNVRYKSGLLGDSTIVYLSASVNFINGTCSVPDQTVTLPSVQHHVFIGVGSTAGTTDFQLHLNNCPAGYNRIGYQLSPLDGVVAGVSGTLKLRPSATATGIGIRINDGVSNEAMTFQQSRAVVGYNSSTGGSPSIPLRASYVQTGQTVRGGSVSAAAQVLLDYQ
ncbi:fimbrial protein [Burkholderia cepacia]|uniref:fimbrial protein n=1 Tax=Burkholderia cepacia TaxID=292 RepID=UPI0026555B01|nr:fimbrial protein [Burkholderia cepacia]MDN7856102.1 fimbrial protein [Burkholderia cepacia]